METNQTDPTTDPAPEDAQGDSASTGPSAEGSAGSAPSSGAPGASTHAPGTGTGFYDWLRRLGLPRRAGWLGGVCAGIGARLGIDPIIVRGIVVVIAVLGAPFVLAYAIAWLLLPDTDGEIHLDRLTRGIVDPAVVGIAVMGVLGLIPLVQGGWLGWQWWDDWPTIADPIFGINLTVPLRILWALILVGGLVALVIWLARRASQNPPTGGGGTRTASAADATGPGSAPVASEGVVAESAVAASTVSSTVSDADAPTRPVPRGETATTEPSTTEPPVPAMGADAAAIAEWREQHEAWRVAHTEWKAGQDQAARAARAQAAAENREKSLALAAQADAARAARRAARPRASAAFVWTALGLALVGGAIVALWALGDADVSGFAAPIALAVATLVLALGMIIAALRRRRSGALAFFTLVTTLTMLGGTGVASVSQQGQLIGPNAGIDLTQSQRLAQPFGDAYLYAFPTVGRTPSIELTQGDGDAVITLQVGATVLLDVSEAGPVEVLVLDENGVVSVPNVSTGRNQKLLVGGEFPVSPASGDDHADARLTLTQRTGSVRIEINEE